MTQNTTILVAATKTGGHLLPATSVADAILRMCPDIRLHMVTSGSSIEDTILEGSNLPVHVIRSGELKGAGRIQRLLNMGQLPLAVIAAMRLIHRLHPAVVAGFGGFTTGPVLAAAFIMGIPTAILEANSIPGLTNKVSGRFVSRVFISFRSTQAYFPKGKTQVTGTPVRHEITLIRKVGKNGPVRNILVFGGSQGAQFLNESMPKILAGAAKKIQGLSVLHQAGKTGVDATIKAYKEAGVDATVFPYMTDMANAYKWADFVVGRAGAGTIAELIEMGMPSLLIPFPFAADDHQYYNALALEQAGAAILARQADINFERLSGEMADVLTSPEKTRKMADAAKALSAGNAAETIAKRLIKMAGYKQ